MLIERISEMIPLQSILGEDERKRLAASIAQAVLEELIERIVVSDCTPDEECGLNTAEMLVAKMLVEIRTPGRKGC